MYSKSTSYSSPYPLENTEEQTTEPSLTWSDLWSQYDEEKWNKVKKEVKKTGNLVYERAPGFFTPFKSINEFGLALAAPIAIPVVLGIVTAIAAIGAALSALAAVSCLLVAGGAGIVGIFSENAQKAAQDALGFAAATSFATAVCTIATVGLAVLTAVLMPLALAQLVTRSVSTVVSPVLDCICDCLAPDEDTPEHESTLKI